jgi:hypothetical protein
MKARHRSVPQREQRVPHNVALQSRSLRTQGTALFFLKVSDVQQSLAGLSNWP